MSNIVHEQRNKVYSDRDEKIRYTDGWLGILASFAVAWSFVQLLGFTFELQYDYDTLLAVYQARQVEYLMGTPFWASAAHAAGISAGLIGAVFLLLRRKTAYHWFMMAIFATLLTLADAFFRGGFTIMGPSATGMTTAGIIVNIFIFWAAYSAYKDGQLQNG